VAAAQRGGRSTANWSVISRRWLRNRNSAAGRPPACPGARDWPVSSSTPRRSSTLLDFFWPIGLLIAIGLSWLFLDRLDRAWRWLFVAAALPALLAAVARRSLPESPYWLARRGRLTEAADVLGAITGHPVDGASLAVSEQPSSSPRELLSPQLRATSAVIVLVWVALNVSYPSRRA
jgi:MFS family permease